MSKKSDKVRALYNKVLDLEVGTPEIEAYFKTLGMLSPSEKQFAYFRVGLLTAEAEVL